MKPGDRVQVTLPKDGCSCGCARTDRHQTVVIEDDSAARRRGTVRVLSPSRKPISEFSAYVKLLDTDE